MFFVPDFSYLSNKVCSNERIQLWEEGSFLRRCCCRSAQPFRRRNRYRRPVPILRDTCVRPRFRPDARPPGGTDQGMLASSYIVFQFEEMGLRPGADDGEGKSFMQRFERYSGRYANVVGFIPGSDPDWRDELISFWGRLRPFGIPFTRQGYRDIPRCRRQCFRYGRIDRGGA